jgi:chitin disaccharide deacetylase
MSTHLRLVTRGDDAGSCRSANRAICESASAGVLRNVSIMACGPAFDEAAEIFRGRDDLCLGLHITLNAEWEKVKWGPVAPRESIASLLDENGYFLETPNITLERGFNADEAMTEIRAQLQKARDAGLDIRYMDEHMGVSWIGLREAIVQLCRDENVLDAYPVPSLPQKQNSNDCVHNWIQSVRTASPGTYVLVTHPGCEQDDMKIFTRENLLPGDVARERDAERRAWCDPRLPQMLRELGVETARYDEVLKAGF